MADYTNSPSMNLPIPTVSVAGGPLWATLLDSCLSIVDGHSHVSGSGVPITPAAMNITTSLAMLNNSLISTKSVQFQAQGSTPGVGSIYESGVDLYYVDGNGANIRLTQSGSIAGAAGSISGLPSGTASASYVAISGTFAWQSATNTAANMDFGSAIMRNTSPNSTYSLTLSPPAGLGSNYALTLPPLPASQKFMTLDASGLMTAPWAVDGSTIVVSSSTVKVPASGITSTELATGSVTQTKLPNRALSTGPVAVGGIGVSSSSGSFSTGSTSYVDVTNLAITITTSGRPVWIGLKSEPFAANAAITYNRASVGPGAAKITIARDGTVLYAQTLENSGAGTNTFTGIPVSALNAVDVPAAGTYAYKIQVLVLNSGDFISVLNAELVVYET